MVVLGYTMLFFAAALGLLGLLAWPPGGLMFALPYFFLIPGLLFAVLGTALLAAGRYRQRRLRAGKGKQGD